LRDATGDALRVLSWDASEDEHCKMGESSQASCSPSGTTATSTGFRLKKKFRGEWPG
jgi:hypothetical protein